MGRNEIIQQEAEEWRRQGRIPDAFHEWIRREYPVGRDQGTERTLQKVLLAVAGVLVIVGIFTLVAEYWSYFNDVQKLWILRLFAMMAIGLGAGLYFVPKTRVLSHVFLPLALPLYLFSMAYADPYYTNASFERARSELDLQETTSLILGATGMLAALLVGLRRFPSLAMGSTPGLLGVLLFLPTFVDLGREGDRAYQWALLALVLLLHAALLLAWLGVVRIPYAWDPFALRLALFANVPMGFFLIVSLVDQYAYREVRDASGVILRTDEVFDATLVGVLTTAAYVGILLGFGLRLGLPELVGISGLFLVGDAIWLGESKGGVIGAVLAILATAVLLGVLAQRGLLRRIFKPRAPPTSGRKPRLHVQPR